MMMPDQKLWQGRKVMVTGHTGFKGAWLCLWLSRLGANVHGFSLSTPPTDPCLSSALGIAHLTHHQGDVCDEHVFYSVMKNVQPEIIFHMAAQSLVRESYIDPLRTWSTNVMGTVSVLEAVRKVGSVRSVVVVTSDKCYDNKNWPWAYRENDRLGGHDPYSASKAGTELVVESYRSSFFRSDACNVATVRAGNVVGGGDWAKDRLVPDCLRAFEKKNPVIIRSPKATRPWQHVLDPLNGYIILAEKLLGSDGVEYAQPWNFGPNDEDALPVENIVAKLIILWGMDAKCYVDNFVHPHEALALKVDSSKAKARLGWMQRLPVSRALEWCVDWHKQFLSNEKPISICIEQIRAYESMENDVTQPNQERNKG